MKLAACSVGWFVSLLVHEEVLLAGLCERKILFRLEIYDRLRQGVSARLSETLTPISVGIKQHLQRTVHKYWYEVCTNRHTPCDHMELCFRGHVEETEHEQWPSEALTLNAW